MKRKFIGGCTGYVYPIGYARPVGGCAGWAEMLK